MGYCTGQSDYILYTLIVREEQELPNPRRNGVLMNVTHVSCLVRHKQQFLALSQILCPGEIDLWAKTLIFLQTCTKDCIQCMDLHIGQYRGPLTSLTLS